MPAWIPHTPLQNGQYIIKNVIGTGGFGETYLALDTEEKKYIYILVYMLIFSRVETCKL